MFALYWVPVFLNIPYTVTELWDHADGGGENVIKLKGAGDCVHVTTFSLWRSK